MDKFEESKEKTVFQVRSGISLSRGPFSQMLTYFLKAGVMFIYFPCYNGHINIKQAKQNTQNPKAYVSSICR